MGAERAAAADDGLTAAWRADATGIEAARLDRAIAVLGERAALRVLDTEFSHAAAIGDDIAAAATGSFTDVDHQVADTETWHGSTPQR
jgi:hypothetical protein